MAASFKIDRRGSLYTAKEQQYLVKIERLRTAYFFQFSSEYHYLFFFISKNNSEYSAEFMILYIITYGGHKNTIHYEKLKILQIPFKNNNYDKLWLDERR